MILEIYGYTVGQYGTTWDRFKDLREQQELKAHKGYKEQLVVKECKAY